MKTLALTLAIAITASHALAGQPDLPDHRAPGTHASQESAREEQDLAAIENAVRAAVRPEMTKREKCWASWNAIWSLAKAGNMEARFGVFWGITGILRFPGDELAKERMAIISYIHALGAASLAGEARRLAGKFPSGFSAFPALEEHQRFADCMKGLRTQECARIAVEERLIPSYEDFASEIDLSIHNGQFLICENPQN